jgi:hypothetical protein
MTHKSPFFPANNATRTAAHLDLGTLKGNGGERYATKLRKHLASCTSVGNRTLAMQRTVERSGLNRVRRADGWLAVCGTYKGKMGQNCRASFRIHLRVRPRLGDRSTNEPTHSIWGTVMLDEASTSGPPSRPLGHFDWTESHDY